MKFTEQGLILTLVFHFERGRVQQTRKVDVTLTTYRDDICDFLCLPLKCLDGRTRLSTRDAFECLMRSAVYFHSQDEFSDKYKEREGKKGRAMIAKMFQYLAEYTGEYEAEKEENQQRREFRAFLEGGDRKALDDFILGHFGKLEEAEGTRRQYEQTESNPNAFTFADLADLLPDLKLREDKSKVAEVMTRLRKVMGKPESKTRTDLDVWFTGKEEEEIKEIVMNAIK